jgi:hypothetical protein
MHYLGIVRYNSGAGVADENFIERASHVKASIVLVVAVERFVRKGCSQRSLSQLFSSISKKPVIKGICYLFPVCCYSEKAGF